MASHLCIIIDFNVMKTNAFHKKTYGLITSDVYHENLYQSFSYPQYEYISQCDITYISYMQIIEGAGKQVIIAKYIWLICIFS